MFKSHMQLVDELKDYNSPKAKITRMIKANEVIQIRRGIFLAADDKTYSLKSLSSIIYGPSYISFQSAMSHYGIIPERVQAITCAVYDKNKNKEFHTPVGDFYYHYIPVRVYPHGTTLAEENGQQFLIAIPEKAICDSLYKVKNIRTESELEKLLIEDWRMDMNVLRDLDEETFSFLLPMYEKKICYLFGEWLKRGRYA